MFKKEEAIKKGLVEYFRENDIFSLDPTQNLKDYLKEEFEKAINTNDLNLAMSSSKLYQDKFAFNVSENLKKFFNELPYGAEFKDNKMEKVLIEDGGNIRVFSLCPLKEALDFSQLDELIEAFNLEVVKLINIYHYTKNEIKS